MARGAKVVELPKREDLEALVGEINTVLNLEPAIKFTKKTTDEELIELIKKECVGNVYEIDFTADETDETVPYFTEESKADFAKLGIEIQAGSPPEEGEEAAPAPAPAAAKKGGAAKAPAAAKTPAAPKTPKAPAEKRYTRDMAVVEAIRELCKKPTDFNTIMNRSDAIYVSKGGKSTPDAVNVNKYTLNGLVAFDVIELKDGKYSFKK